VIPLFNKLPYIKRCLDSVIKQGDLTFEIIVVDDGSTDSGAEFVADNYPQVRLIKQINSGVSTARNKGIAAASSEFVALLDADDFWQPEFLFVIDKLIKKYPQAATFCTHYGFVFDDDVKLNAKIKSVPESDGLIEDYFASCFNSDLPITASSVCIRRSLLQQLGGFPIGMEMGEDQVVWAKLACQAPIAYSSKTCVYYDQSVVDSACHINLITEPAPQVAIYQQMLIVNEVPARLLLSLKQLIHLTIMSCVKNNLVNGKRLLAFKLLLTHSGLRWDKYRLLGFMLLLVPKQIINRLYQYARSSR
jgi:hypothetical protein